MFSGWLASQCFVIDDRRGAGDGVEMGWNYTRCQDNEAGAPLRN